MRPRTISKTLFSHALRACALAAAVCSLAAPLRADFIGSVQIQFDSGGNSGVYDIPVPGTGDSYTWGMNSPTAIYDADDINHTGPVLAYVNKVDITLDGDPGVSLGFNVTAGAGLTHISVVSSTVSFAPLVNPLAFASASITVTDANSSMMGATATGTFPGINSYQAVYNGTSIFANLVQPVSAPMDGSNTLSDRFPVSGSTVINDSVSSIMSAYDFYLTGYDTASGTSRFNVAANNVPEPSTLVLALVGGTAMLWRFRRRRAG